MDALGQGIPRFHQLSDLYCVEGHSGEGWGRGGGVDRADGAKYCNKIKNDFIDFDPGNGQPKSWSQGTPVHSVGIVRFVPGHKRIGLVTAASIPATCSAEVSPRPALHRGPGACSLASASLACTWVEGHMSRG